VGFFKNPIFLPKFKIDRNTFLSLFSIKINQPINSINQSTNQLNQLNQPINSINSINQST